MSTGSGDARVRGPARPLPSRAGSSCKVGAVHAVETPSTCAGARHSSRRESGCGKSTTGSACSSSAPGLYEGGDLAHLAGSRLRVERKRMQIVFQDPYASLDGPRPVGDAIGEPLLVHRMGSKAERKTKLETVGINPNTLNRYPTQRRPASAPSASPGRWPWTPTSSSATSHPQHLHPRPREIDRPAAAVAARTRPRLPVHRPRPLGRAPHGRHVSGRVVDSPRTPHYTKSSAPLHPGAAQRRAHPRPRG